MKVVEETPDMLVLRHTPWLVTGIMLAMFGGVIAALVLQPEYGSEFYPLILTATILFMIVFLHFFGTKVTVTFARFADLVTKQQSHILPFWPFSSEATSIALSKIKRAAVLSDTSGDGTTYKVTLVIEEGEPLPEIETQAPWWKRVTHWLMSHKDPTPKEHWPLTEVSSSNKAEWEKAAAQINQWLGVSA